MKEYNIGITETHSNKTNLANEREDIIINTMADCCSRSVVTFVTILLFIGIAGMVCGAMGTSWFKQSRLDTHIGLLKGCRRENNECEERKNILRFKQDQENFLEGVESRCTYFVILFLLCSCYIIPFLRNSKKSHLKTNFDIKHVYLYRYYKGLRNLEIRPKNIFCLKSF